MNQNIQLTDSIDYDLQIKAINEAFDKNTQVLKDTVASFEVTKTNAENRVNALNKEIVVHDKAVVSLNKEADSHYAAAKSEGDAYSRENCHTWVKRNNSWCADRKSNQSTNQKRGDSSRKAAELEAQYSADKKLQVVAAKDYLATSIYPEIKSASVELTMMETEKTLQIQNILRAKEVFEKSNIAEQQLENDAMNNSLLNDEDVLLAKSQSKQNNTTVIAATVVIIVLVVGYFITKNKA